MIFIHQFFTYGLTIFKIIQFTIEIEIVRKQQLSIKKLFQIFKKSENMIVSELQATIISKTFYTNEGQTVFKTFKILSKIYSNQFYTIYHAIDLENQQQKITIKAVNKPHILNKQKILCQINNHKRMNGHQNFITLKNVYQDQKCIYIIMETWGTSLEDIIKRRKYLTQKEVRLIFCQMVNILEHLRKHNIGHQNIKLENLLVCQNTMKIKLIDFSDSVCLENTFNCSNSFSQNISSSSIGSSKHLGKKQINPYSCYQDIVGVQTDHLAIYSKDIWAFGVTIFVLLVGEHPFCSFGSASALKIRNCSYEFPQFRQRDFVSNVWKQLIKKIFVPKNNRIKLSQLIQHPLKMQIEQNQVLNYDISITPGFMNNCTFYDPFVCQNDRRLRGYKKNKNGIRNIMKKFNNREFQQNLMKKCQKGQKDWLSGIKQSSYMNQPILVNKRVPYEDPPIILKQPLSLNKFHYAEEINCLGYVVNKSVGILFPDGSLIIGHDEDDYCFHNYQPMQLRDSQQEYGVEKENQRSLERFVNINCFQSGFRNTQEGRKQQKSDVYIESKIIPTYSSNARILKKQKVKHNSFQITNRKYAIYKHFLKYYGKRVIKSDLSVWVEKVYKIDALWIFTFNNKVWQINMGDGVCLIDQYGYGWWISTNIQNNSNIKSRLKPKVQVDRIKTARKIVNWINSQLQDDILGFKKSNKRSESKQPSQEIKALYSYMQQMWQGKLSRQGLQLGSKAKIEDLEQIFQLQ